MTKRYDPENFLIRSDGMTCEQYKVLRKWLGENFNKHPSCGYGYKHNDNNITDRVTWTYRGTSGGYTCYSNTASDTYYTRWCDISKNKPPVITYEEFEKYILNNENGADTMTVDFPDFDFKISCGDRPEVRQWLKDNGCKWFSGEDITDFLVEKKFLRLIDMEVLWYDEDYYNESTLPELTPTFGVTGWTVEQKDSEEKLALQESISKMEQELEQMKQRVQEIK